MGEQDVRLCRTWGDADGRDRRPRSGSHFGPSRPKSGCRPADLPAHRPADPLPDRHAVPPEGCGAVVRLATSTDRPLCHLLGTLLDRPIARPAGRSSVSAGSAIGDGQRSTCPAGQPIPRISCSRDRASPIPRCAPNARNSGRLIKSSEVEGRLELAKSQLNLDAEAAAAVGAQIATTFEPRGERRPRHIAPNTRLDRPSARPTHAPSAEQAIILLHGTTAERAPKLTPNEVYWGKKVVRAPGGSDETSIVGDRAHGLAPGSRGLIQIGSKSRRAQYTAPPTPDSDCG